MQKFIHKHHQLQQQQKKKEKTRNNCFWVKQHNTTIHKAKKSKNAFLKKCNIQNGGKWYDLINLNHAILFFLYWLTYSSH